MLHRLNAYRIMWIFVYFDLPSVTKIEKKRYRLFKDRLQKDGFYMMQYSIYVRHCTSRENAEVHKRRVKKMLPPNGHVIIHMVTDKQFGMMDVYYNTKKQKSIDTEHGQLIMF